MGHRPAVLVHLCPSDEWSSTKVQGELRPESLASVGFIHLSRPEQVHLPANRLYRGRHDLVLLHIDPDRLDSPIRWEPGVATDPEEADRNNRTANFSTIGNFHCAPSLGRFSF